MTRDEVTAWALANGWQMIDGHPSLTKPSAPSIAIVRLVLKATVASLEIKKPAGKWEKVASESYSKIAPDPDSGIPGGLGFTTISGLTMLMRDNKDRLIFAKMGGHKSEPGDKICPDLLAIRAGGGARTSRQACLWMLKGDEMTVIPGISKCGGDLRRTATHPDFWYPIAWSTEVAPGKTQARTFRWRAGGSVPRQERRNIRPGRPLRPPAGAAFAGCGRRQDLALRLSRLAL